MAREIFRKKPLERLYTPEQLDQLLVVIKPKGWIALLCLLLLAIGTVIWIVVARIPVQVVVNGLINTPEGFFTVKAMEEGSVVDIKVKKGARVDVGQPLATLFNPRNENLLKNIPFKLLKKEESAFTITSPAKGTVFRIDVSLQDYVQKGMPILLLNLAPKRGEQLEAIGYMPVNLKGKIHTGMHADVIVAGQTFKGTVACISPHTLSRAEILQGLPSLKWLEFLNLEEEPVLEVSVEFEKSSLEKGKHLLFAGVPCTMRITTAEKKPFQFILP